MPWFPECSCRNHSPPIRPTCYSRNPCWAVSTLLGYQAIQTVPSRQRTARLLDTLAEGEAENLFRLALTAAHAGDTLAPRIVLDRIWPIRKGRPIRLDFPADLDPLGSLGVILRGMAAGDISPEGAQAAAVTVLAQDRLRQAHARDPRDLDPKRVLILPDNGRGDGPPVFRGNPEPEPPKPEPVPPAPEPDDERRDLIGLLSQRRYSSRARPGQTASSQTCART